MRLNHVPARAGLLWVRLGVQTFFRQPLAMAGLFFMFMMVISVVTMVPLLGTALALALLPAATLGLMAAAREAASGKFPMPVVLASAFRAGRERMNAMMVLGGMYTAGFLIVMGLSALFDGGQFALLYLGGGAVSLETVQQPEFQRAMWVSMLLYLPLALLFWHAPALVHWHGVSPVKSLFFSVLACWQNKGAMVVFFVGWVGVFLLGGLAITLLSSVLGGATLFTAMLMPTALLMASMFFTSIYFTFRDSFIVEDGPPLP